MNDILDFSKIEADKLDLEATAFSIIRVAEEVAGLVAGAAGAMDSDLTSPAPDLHLLLEPEVGFEPTTCSLRVS